MERWLVYEIPDAYVGHKISEFLHNKGYSNQNLAQLKRMPKSILIRSAAGSVDSHGRWEYMNYRFQPADVLTVHIQEHEVSQKIPPVELPFPIVYEDEDLVVVNKPAHMPIHPSMNNYENTLGNAAAWYYRSQGKAFVYRCVNRLDKDTTGLTILAKHMVSSSILYHQMAARQIHREYLAIVEGSVLPDTGVIDLPLGRMPGSAIGRMVDMADGERAVTHYRVLARADECMLRKRLGDQAGSIPASGLSLLSLWLETGRTHQIRVHMSHVGHPLIGDFLYNPDSHLMERQALHACRLCLVHPITGEPLTYTAPMPADMRLFFDGSSLPDDQNGYF